jgi:post-segregation antitoxin (ccd killing protein)
MSDQESYQRRAFAEAVAPYGSDTSTRAPHTKLSISLPTELVELVKAVAADTGSSVSATIAASLRRTLEEAEQERLDAAIEAQNEENLEWANAYLPITAKLWSELEW